METASHNPDHDQTDSDQPASRSWDNHLSFHSPDALESMRNSCFLEELPGDPQTPGDYDHLKKTGIDLNLLKLTDKQAMALSLVFFGGFKKNRAAKIMKISAQALNDHVKAGLKKIQVSLA